MAVAGPAPEGSRKPARDSYDFGSWLAGHEFRTAEPDGWWYHDYGDHRDPDPCVRFSPEWKTKDALPGETANYINGRYFRAAVRLGAVTWEWRSDGCIVVARDASGGPVAMIATMRLPKEVTGE